MAIEIKSNGLFNKVKDRLKGAKAYALADGRKETRERLYKKLKGQYYTNDELNNRSDRVKVETVAGLTYQMRPSYHYRRPHVSVSAITPKFITEFDGQEKTLNNTKNAVMMEIALNQELRAMEMEEEVNAMIQDWLCPYEFGAIKFGYGNKTLYSSYDVDKVNMEGVWALRTCPEDIYVDWQAHGKRSIGYYFNAIHKPVQWIKDNKDFNSSARAEVSSDKMPDFLKSRLTKEEAATPYDMGTICEYHDLETGQIGYLSEDGKGWLIDPYDFPYHYRGPQFVFLCPMPLNNDFYGRCYISLAEPQIDETNSYRTRISRIFKRWPVVNFFKTGAWTIDQQRKWADADDCDNLEVTEPADIDTRTMPNLPSDIWRFQEIAERDMEKNLGTSAMRRGEVSAVKPTTAQIIEGHGNIRDADVREDVAKVYKQGSLKIIDLMIQFYDTPRWVKLTGGMKAPDGIPVEETEIGPFALYTNKDIAGNYDVDPDVTSMVPINNELKAKVLIETLKAVPTLPPDVQQKFHSRYDIVEMLYDIVKMQGVDLAKWNREEEPEKQDDPWAENEHVLKGGILHEPHDKEPHGYHRIAHRKVLEVLAYNPSDPRFIELARHDKMHEAKEANQRVMIPPTKVTPPPGGEMTPGQGPAPSGMGAGIPGGLPTGPSMRPLPPTTPGGGGGMV